MTEPGEVVETKTAVVVEEPAVASTSACDMSACSHTQVVRFSRSIRYLRSMVLLLLMIRVYATTVVLLFCL